MARGVDRQTQLARRAKVCEQLEKKFSSVERGFNDQADRSDSNIDYWDMYNCRTNGKQKYKGVFSDLYVPLFHNAVEALKTRFLNQIFPVSGRYIEVTTGDGDEKPYAIMALLEQHIERAKLKSKVIPPLLVAGEVEGQYTLHVAWESRERNITVRQSKPIEPVAGIPMPAMGEIEVLVSEPVNEDRIRVDVVADNDFLILPATAETIDAALDAGGSVTTICRWSKERIEKAIEDGEIDKDLSAELLVEMGTGRTQVRNEAKHLADSAGIKAGGKFALIYRTWTRIVVGDDERLVLAYYAGDGWILGCRLCPYWCDRPDIFTKPVRPMPGVAKGISPAMPCADMQYMANDYLNMGLDSGILTVNPVVMTDPEKNPRVSSMVLDNMAVWEVSPQNTQVLTFPAVYQHAFNIVQAAERYIEATLGVNAAMLPQQATKPGAKPNQAMVAMEQQIDLLSTAVEVSQIEELLSDVVSFMAQLDMQYRDTEITVRSVGRLGVEAEMETVPPLQIGARWRFRWFGVEAARTAQQVQQQIAFVNVLRQFSQDPAVAQSGYRVNPVPVLREGASNAFGPRIAPEVFENISDQLAIDPQLENEMLAGNMFVPVSPMDNDPKHIQAHMRGMQQTIDEAARHQFMQHIGAHQRQMQQKAQAQAMQQMMQQLQAAGGRAQPGMPRRGGQGRPPMPGGQPQMPRQMRQPPGAVPVDQLNNRGVVQMPRRM